MKFDFNKKEYERTFLQPGGYVGKIVNVAIEGETIKVFFDIEQGEHKGIYIKEYKNAGGGTSFDASKWSKKATVNFNFKYKGAKFAFADLLNNLEKSNQTFKWNNETDDLKNKLIGVVYRKNIYDDKFGERREGTDFPAFTTVKNIANGNFSIDPVEKEEKTDNTTSSAPFANVTEGYSVSDDDIQF